MPPPAFLQGLLNSYPAELLGKAAKSPLGQGIGRALVPLAIGGIAQAFAGSRDKGRVFAPYLGLGTQQILGALDQPQREQQQLLGLLGQMGQLSSTAPSPGAAPVANLAGQPFFRDTRTLQEANPGLFPTNIAPESRVQFQKLAQPPLAQGALPPLAPAPPQSPYDRALGVIGAQPNSARGQGALAELLLKQGIAEQEGRQRREGLETLTQLGQQQQGGQGQPRLRYGLDARGNITASVLPPAAPRAPGLLEQYGTPEELRAYARDRLTRRPEPRQERQPRAPSRYDRLDQLVASGQITPEQRNQAILGGGGLGQNLEEFLARERIKDQLGNERAAVKDELDLLKDEEKTLNEKLSGGGGVPPVPRALVEKVRSGESLSEEELDQLPISYGLLSGDPVGELRGDVERLDQIKQERQRVRKSGSSAPPPAKEKAKAKGKAAPGPTTRPVPAGPGEFDFDPTTGGLVPRR